MPSTYSDRKVALDEIAERIQANSKRLSQARATVSTAEADLTAMQTAYTSIVQDINTDAAANPADQAYQLQKIEKDKLVSEFQGLKTKATNIKNAIDGVG
jgi:hypothetical protein